MPINWKVLTIILLVVIILENLFFAWGYYLVVQDENNYNECAYEICADYPQAYFENEICSCYDYSMLGDLEIIKQEWLK